MSADAELRSGAIRHRLRERSGPILLVAPTRGAAEDLLRSAGVPLLGLHRPTLPQLAADLASSAMARRRLAPVRGPALVALAARAVSQSRRELEYFTPVVDAPGLPGALARTLEELRAVGTRPENLEALSSRGRDLARLLRAFEEELDRHRLVDPAGLFRLAIEGVVPGRSPVGLPLYLLDPLPKNPLEDRLLKALAEEASEVLATAVAGDEDGISRLEDILGEKARVMESPPVERKRRRLERLRRRIFAAEPEIPDEPEPENAGGETEDGTGEDQGLVFLSAPGEGRECVEIARRLLSLAREGVPFDRCAVALRQPETYIPLIEEAFERAQIPVHLTRGARRPDPAGRAFLALLACADEQLSAARFAEYLSLGQLPAADLFGAPPAPSEVPWVAPDGDQMVFKSAAAALAEESPEPAVFDPEAAVVSGALKAPRQWERLLVDAAVIRGRDRWRRRLDGVIKEHELQLRSAVDLDERDQQRIEEQLRHLRTLKSFALPLVDDLDEFPEKAPWGAWLKRLDPLASRSLRDPERVLAVLAELRPMSEVGPVSLLEVRRVLADRLSLLRTEPTRRRFGKVLVSTVDELRGRTFHTVFLPGLAEGLFPRRALEDPLLLDADRRRLDPRLITQERRFAQERLLLRIAIGAAGHRLVTSYPSLDAGQGRSRVPSFYALDLLRAAEGRLPELERLEERAASGSSLRLGWPAPKDPNAAIDDAEYDLATLIRLLGRPVEEVAGRGRYLLDTNIHLRRSLRNRYSRWAQKWSRADGLVTAEPDALRLLKSRRSTEHGYSPTALQHFAACPYRFYLHAVIRLRPRERFEQLEQMDPLTRGSLFHQVQFELLTLLKERRLLPMQGRHGETGYLDTLYRLTDQTLEAVAERYREELAPAIPRVWHSEVEGLKLDLRGWIRSVATAAESEPWVPAHFELAFGLSRKHRDDGHDPESSVSEVEIAGGRKLRGSIDLVERDPGHGTLRVTDHKTGRARLPKGRRLYVGGGEILQPLLYGLVAEALLDRPVESGRLHYCTRRGGYRLAEAHLDDEARDTVDVFFDTLDRHVEEGFLPAAPREDACRWCDYRTVCGPNEEARTARKHGQRLRDLKRVRALP